MISNGLPSPWDSRFLLFASKEYERILEKEKDLLYHVVDKGTIPTTMEVLNQLHLSMSTWTDAKRIFCIMIPINHFDKMGLYKSLWLLKGSRTVSEEGWLILGIVYDYAIKAPQRDTPNNVLPLNFILPRRQNPSGQSAPSSQQASRQMRLPYKKGKRPGITNFGYVHTRHLYYLTGMSSTLD